MFKIMATYNYDNENIFDYDYSREVYDTKEAADEALTEAKLHEIDCEYIDKLYIKEV